MATHNALRSRGASVAGPSARVRVPLAIANQLIAGVVRERTAVRVGGRLGELLGVDDVSATLREVVMVPAEVGQRGPSPSIAVDVVIDLADLEGPLASLRARGDVAAVVEPDDRGIAESVAIAIRWDSLRDLDLALTDRAKAAAERAIPSAVKRRLPRVVVEHGSSKVARRSAELVYAALRETALARLGELTRIRMAVPAMPVTRVDVAPTDTAVELLVHTSLPIRAAVGAPQAAAADAITVEISASAVAELANWAIAQGIAPQRYTRNLSPNRDGEFVPHFDWRGERSDRPFIVHMFRTVGACAHFEVAALPHLEVAGDQVRGFVTNKQLERADTDLVMAALAHLKEGLAASTSPVKQASARRTLRVGRYEVATRLVGAHIESGDLRAVIAVGPLSLATAREHASGRIATNGLDNKLRPPSRCR